LSFQRIAVSSPDSPFPLNISTSFIKGADSFGLFGGKLKNKIEELLTRFGVSSTSNRLWIIAYLMWQPDQKIDMDALLTAATEHGQSKSTTYRNLSLLQRHTIISIRRGENVRLTKLKMEITIL